MVLARLRNQNIFKKILQVDIFVLYGLMRAFMNKYRISPRNHIQRLNPGKWDRRYASKGSSCIICNYKMRHAPNQHLHFSSDTWFELWTKNSSEFKLYDSASWSIADETLWFFFLIKIFGFGKMICLSLSNKDSGNQQPTWHGPYGIWG